MTPAIGTTLAQPPPSRYVTPSAHFTSTVGAYTPTARPLMRRASLESKLSSSEYKAGLHGEIGDPMIVEHAEDVKVDRRIVQTCRQRRCCPGACKKWSSYARRDDDRILAREERQRGDDFGPQVGPAERRRIKLRQPSGGEFGPLEEAVARAERNQRLLEIRIVRDRIAVSGTSPGTVRAGLTGVVPSSMTA